MKKIRILQVIGNLRIGGAENVAMNFSRYLNKEKFQCDFLVFEGEKGEYEEEALALGSKIIKIQKPNSNYFKYYLDLKELLIRGQYDIVHTHLLLNNGIILKAAKDAGISKRISHSHSTNMGRKATLISNIYERIMKKMIEHHATEMIACGEDAGVYLYGKTFTDKGIIIKNGVVIDEYKFSPPKREKMRENLKLENKFVIGHIGRLVPVKNHNFLIHIFLELLKVESESILVLIGDGELKNEIKKSLIKKGIEEKVLFLGNRTDISDLLNAMDVFVFPSIYEGLPLALIEAQACSLPCIVSNNVTNEIKLTEAVSFLSLNSSTNQWVKEILKFKTYKRIDTTVSIEGSGYSIFESIKKMELLYES